MGVAVGGYDNDGDPGLYVTALGDGLVDIAVSNDTVQNFFFHNLGGGRFEEIALSTGTAFDALGSPRAGMGIDWADFKNDGTLGLAVGNFANEMVALYVCDDPKA